MAKLKQRPSPKMVLPKEPLDDAAKAAWKYLGFVVVILFFIVITQFLSSSSASQGPPRRLIHTHESPPLIWKGK
jgi:hypothetical protein